MEIDEPIDVFHWSLAWAMAGMEGRRPVQTIPMNYSDAIGVFFALMEATPCWQKGGGVAMRLPPTKVSWAVVALHHALNEQVNGQLDKLTIPEAELLKAVLKYIQRVRED